MNQAQRNFLIKKIEDNVKAAISGLEAEKPPMPNLNNFLLHAVLSNNFEIKTNAEIREAIRQKALRAIKDENWLSGERSTWSSNHSKVGFKIEDIFVLSGEYTKLKSTYDEANIVIMQKITSLRQQSETLITRIQLASDKTLDKMINEVDDMGDISLMDTKIRYLNA